MPKDGFYDKRVEGEGPRGAKILLVGESAGMEEERTGRPFVGSAGQELDRLLAAAGIERRHCRIENIAPYRPFGNKDLAFMPAGKPHEKYLEGIVRVKNYCEEHKPNVVVAIGKYALWGLTMEDGITNWRGSIIESSIIPGQKIIPILHPAHLIRGNWKMRNPTIWDLQKAKVESEFPETNLPTYDITIAESGAQLDEAFRELMQAEELAGDLEHFGGRNLACFGFAPSAKRAIVVPHRGQQTVEFYRAVLESGIPLIFQNAMFEMTYMAAVFGIYCKNVAWDTMVASHAMFPTLPKDLGFLTSVYTRQPYYKEERKEWRRAGNLGILWDYNAKDNCCTFGIRQAQISELDEFEAWTTFKFMMDLLWPYAEATVKGVRANVELIDNLAATTEAQIEALQKLLDERFGKPVNVNSPLQVKQIVFEELGLPKRLRKGKLTSQQDVLMDLAAKTDSPELLTIVKLRRLRKLRSSYATRDILDDDLRFRCHWKVAGPKSGRLSSSETAWGAGTNLQNQPVRHKSIFRRVFIPDPGKSFLSLDYQQGESVVVAYLANDVLEIQWHQEGLDSHRMLAAQCLDKNPEDIDDVERFIFKTAHHALNYRMGPLKFMYTVNQFHDETGIGITAEQAKKIRTLVHTNRPALTLWWSSTIRTLRETATLANLAPSKRKRTFIEGWNDDVLNDAISWVPQSTIVDIAHEGVRRYWYDPEMEELRKEGRVDFLLQQHDGGIWQADDEIFDDVAEKLMKMHIIPLQTEGREFIVAVEAKRGPNWKDMEEIAVLRSL